MQDFENPFDYFSILYREWLLQSNDSEASWVNVATTDLKGCPNSRILLLKEHSERGFFFVTNLNSIKVQELKVNPYASLTFFWDLLGQQVRIRGKVSFASVEESDRYWHSRNRQSQIGAYASKQSQKLESRELMLNSLKQFTEKFKELEVIPRPEFWGGFWVEPEEYDFWQKAEFRMHDRLQYLKNTSGEWTKGLLYP